MMKSLPRSTPPHMDRDPDMAMAKGGHSVHAVLDLPSRALKARKILEVMGIATRRGTLRLLEVGCGSGGIAHFLGTLPGSPFAVDAVDVEDNRLVRDGYRFTKVDSVVLPFADDEFDAVISNHVIEHVGEVGAQRRHLAELRRVLRRDGAGYLAVPNRWQLVEPHFRLPFLSWLAPGLRSPYVRLARRGEHYDCRPLTRVELEELFELAGLAWENACVQALRSTLAIEGRRWSLQRRILGWVPDRVLWTLRGVCPTHVYRFWRGDVPQARIDAAGIPEPAQAG